MRVQSVVQELRGEKIDIIQWTDDQVQYVRNALSPARVSRISVQETDKTMQVIVPDDQLSLAIGKRGQNVRLAAKLTHWKIDIKSEGEVDLESERQEALRRAEQVFHTPKRSVASISSPASSALSVSGEEGATVDNAVMDAPTLRDDISLLEGLPS
jgi:polyribonucleotide nucleotidyltransferase